MGPLVAGGVVKISQSSGSGSLACNPVSRSVSTGDDQMQRRGAVFRFALAAAKRRLGDGVIIATGGGI